MEAQEAVVDSEADAEAAVVDLVEDAVVVVAAAAVVEAVTLENKPTSKDDQETGSVPPNAATQISPGAMSATSAASPSLKAPVAVEAAVMAEGVVAVEASAEGVVATAAAVVAALATAVVVAADLEVAAAVLVTVEAADPCGVAAGAAEIDTALTECIATFPLHSSANTSSSQIIYSLLRFNTGVQKRPLLFRKKGLLPSPWEFPSINRSIQVRRPHIRRRHNLPQNVFSIGCIIMITIEFNARQIK